MKKHIQKLDTLGLLLLVAGFVWYSVSNTWGKWNLGLVIAGILIAITGIAANYRQILASLGKRSTKYAANYVVSLILIIAVVSGLNYLGQRHTKRYDTTSSRQYTLAPQTTQVLGKLTRDVEIKAFFPGGDHPPLRGLLVEYRTLSRHIRYDFIDPDKQPDVAKRYGVKTYGVVEDPFTRTPLKFGTLVLTLGNREEKIEKRTEEVKEEDLTNAIIKVGREAKKVYFVQGHGEKDTEDTEAEGYSEAKSAIESQGYSVGTVNLTSEGKIPVDAKVLIVAGPKKEPFPQELQFIDDFLNKGLGSLFLLLDIPPAPSLSAFLNKWGVQVDEDVILDVSGAGRLIGKGPAYPLVLGYENHKITERFNLMTFFPFTRSLQPEKSVPEGITVETLFKSGENSFGETNLDDPKISFNQGKDLKGPLPLALAVTKEIKPSSGENPAATKVRLVVTGTSNFPINAFFQQQGNGNMFLNMVSWLAEDEDLIAIRPKQSDDRRIVLSQSQMSAVRLFTVFILPGIALIAGIIVVMKRRRR